MARPRPMDYRQEMRDHDFSDDRPQDWQELRNDLLDLLNRVDQHEYEQADDAHPSGRRDRNQRSEPARQRPAETSLDERHRRALDSVSETLERFSQRDDGSVSSAIDEIRGRHAGVPNRRATRVQEYQSSVHDMSDRLQKLGRNIKENNIAASDSREITNQLAQLTHTVELLAGAVGESGQVKRLESQIAGLADIVSKAPAQGQSEVNDRLERIASIIEHMSDAQYQLADRPVTMLEELSNAQGQGFDSVEAGVRGIYDRIDVLEQNIGVSPADIDRLSADMAELARAVQAGVGEDSLLSKIDALNARMNGIEDSGTSGALSGDVEVLRDAIRDAIEPRFHEINSKIDTLDGKIKSKNGGKSVDLEDHIRQLIARMDQTGSQLTEMMQFRSENPEAGPDLAALAEMVAERTSKAVSQTTKSAAANAGSVDERVHKSIQQVDARLARLEETLKSSAPQKGKVTFVAKAPEGGQKPAAKDIAGTPKAGPAPQQTAQKAAAKPLSAQPKLPPTAVAGQTTSRTSDPADAMRMHPADERPLIDPGFGQSSQQHVPSAQPTPTKSVPELRPDAQPASSAAPSGFDPSKIEPPRQPRSSFADDNGSTFSSPEPAESEPAPHREAGSNRNTFIEAARRAAQKHNPVEDDDQSASLLSRILEKLRPNLNEAPELDESDDQESSPSGGLRARLASLGRKSISPDMDDQSAEAPQYHMEDAYDDRRDEEAEHQAGFLTRHRRPLLLAGLVIMVSLLALNLVQRRIGSETPASQQSQPAQAGVGSAEPAGLLSQPLLDPQPTGSVDPFMRQIPGTGLPNQEMTDPPLSGTSQPLHNGPRIDALETSAFSVANRPTINASTAPAQAIVPQLKYELPPEAIGPLALREAAAQGDPRAQFEVAAIYGEGRAVPSDPKASAQWYERAAAQGFAPAEYRIGNIYEHGQGVAKDIAQAKIWYERAAQAGNRMSMHNLAALHASGALGKQQFGKAAEWFERAAGLGLTDSQFNLGMLHARGLGVPQDMATSYKWFSLAATRGDDGAAKARDDVARSLDADTISRLRAEIAEWRPLQIDLKSNFAPIGTWAEDFNPGNSIGDENVIKEVQSALNRLGYDVGTPDGLMGPRTREAIATFERSTGMSESGAVNPRLLAVLGSQPV